MSRLMRVASVLLLAASINAPASGQGHENADAARGNSPRTTHAPGPSVEAATPLTADQQSAVLQLDQLLRLTKEFEDDGLKIRAQAQIADVLWKYDEPRARGMFEDAFRGIESLELLNNGVGRNASKTSEFARFYALKYKLRKEVLLLISRRDSRMATALVEALAKSASGVEAGSAATNSAAASGQAMLYMELAARLAQTDPQGAARLVRLSIDNGINPMLVPVLTQLRSRDPALADQLFAYAIVVARKETVSLTEAITWMAPYLFPDFGRVPQVTDERARGRYGSAQSSPANPALIARYLGFAHTSIVTHLNMTQAGAVGNPDALAEIMSDCQFGQMMLPLFERFAPESAATLRVRLEAIAGVTSAMSGRPGEETSDSPGGVQELLEAAETAQDTPLKDAFYARAALRAAQGGDFETAFSIVKKISDELLRNSLDAAVRFRAALVAVGKGELDLAYDYGKDLSDLRQRAAVVGKITTEHYKRHESDRAAQLLDEAARSVMAGEGGRGQVWAMLTLTETATQFDPARGFELMASAVRATNSATSSPAQDEAQQTQKHGAGEAPLTSDGYMELALTLDRSLTLLAQLDFNRSLFLAQSLRNKELATFAQLTVCRAVLSPSSRS